MARGPKKHMKRLNAPKHWMLDKMGGVWAPRPSPGPHKLRECLPLILILRNKLKYALNKQEVQSICMQRLVKVDGKVRTDSNFPAGFMDVVQIPKSSDQFRLLYDTKGRFVLNRIDDAEAKYKLCRIVKQEKTKRGIPYVVTHDGRTIRYADPLVKVNDTAKVNIETGKIVDFAKFEMGQTVMITKGRNTGRVGIMEHRERHPGSFDIIQIRDAADNTFATRMTNVFVLGKGDTPWVSLPRGHGIKKTIHQQKSEKDALKA